MGKSDVLARRRKAVFLAAILLFARPLSAADLQKQAAQNYARYIAVTQAQVDAELAQREPYLWVERLPAARRTEAVAQLRNGGVVIEKLETLDAGKPIAVPGGLIHHWIGTAFVPGATLAQTLAFMEDYDHKVEYFKPDIVRSKILKHEGDDYFVLLRFYQKKIITTVIDTDQEVHYHVVDKNHAWSRSSRDAGTRSGKSRKIRRAPGARRARPGICLEAEHVLALRRKGRRHLSGVPGHFAEPRHTDRIGMDGGVVRVQRAA